MENKITVTKEEWNKILSGETKTIKVDGKRWGTILWSVLDSDYKKFGTIWLKHIDVKNRHEKWCLKQRVNQCSCSDNEYEILSHKKWNGGRHK